MQVNYLVKNIDETIASLQKFLGDIPVTELPTGDIQVGITQLKANTNYYVKKDGQVYKQVGWEYIPPAAEISSGKPKPDGWGSKYAALYFKEGDTEPANEDVGVPDSKPLPKPKPAN